MKNLLRSIGPSLIVAAVVLGPGSITTSTKAGAAFGYGPLWVLLCLLALLVGTASLAAWLGATLDKPLCRELSHRLGPWAGWIIGIALFVIVAGFQSSNNMAVVAGIEPLLGEGVRLPRWGVTITLLAINAIVIAILYLSKDLYTRIERIMKFFILAMVLAFIWNFFWAGPSVGGAVRGLIPDFAPFRDASQAILLVGMIATTYSVAGAFYQGYLVRERGWGPERVRSGFRDSLIGMCVLVGITAIVLMTSAATFHGKVHPDALGDAGSMSAQLGSAFGPLASYIFCFGFLAGAFSSFLVNAMIGGHVFSDGMGLGSRLHDRSTLHATTAALLVGMIVGLLALTTDFDRTTTIVIAQASTVIGGPAIMAALLYLGIRQRLQAENKPPLWMLAIVSVGALVSLALAARTGMSVGPTIVSWFSR
jgi:manganese transport protein